MSCHVDLTADVLVIGGGLAGTWAALTAAQPGLDAVLTEIVPLGSGPAVTVPAAAGERAS